MKKVRIIFVCAMSLFVIIAFSAVRKASLKSVEVIKDFEVAKYLGTWHEIARLDFKWEKNLEQVTATYSVREDGKIKVDNKGYDTLKRKWVQSVGKAKFAGERNEGRLAVSFFGPFYSAYNIVAIDPEYKYVLVVGESTEYMWILSREKTIPEKIKNEYLDKAKSLGIKTEKLLWLKW